MKQERERYFYKNLKYLRSKKKISQQELADTLKIDRSTISRWESNEMDITVGNVLKIADVFNVSLVDLVGKDLRLEDENYISVEEKDFVEEIADILKNSTLSQKKQEKILNDIEFYREDD